MGHIQSLISVEKRPQLPRDVFTKFNSKKVTIYYTPHLDNKHCTVTKTDSVYLDNKHCPLISAIFFPSNNK